MRSKCIILSFLFLISIAASYGQHNELNRKHLLGEWCASNDDSLFFKTDTLVLLKRTDNNVVLDRMCVSPDMAREQGLLNCMEFVNLRLRTRGRFEMWLYSGHSSDIWLTPMHWRFDEGVLSLSADDFAWHFELLESNTVRFFSEEFSFYDQYANPRLKLKRFWPDSVMFFELDSIFMLDSLGFPSSEEQDSLDFMLQQNTLRNLDME
jgi:hypothetical protein